MTVANQVWNVVVIGAGAAGIAAARRLRAAGASALMIEARGRIGGRAWSRSDVADPPIDMGCGWLHSADRNWLVGEAEALGMTIDRSAPSFRDRVTAGKFSDDDRRDFAAAQDAFYERVESAAQRGDGPASDRLESGGRWNALIDAVSGYVNGVGLAELSSVDFVRYEDSGVNWRVAEGYGAFFERWARDLPVALDCPVRRVDHSGARIRVEADRGDFVADAVIVAAPTDVLARGTIRFDPGLPDILQAAYDLPLGVDDKLFMSLEGAEEFAPDTRLFGATDRARTGAYAIRPMGRPIIEAFFGGDLARDLEGEGVDGFFNFAAGELTAALGGAVRKRVRPLAASAWRLDPWSLGAYSHARIGCADARTRLAAPASERLIFAGEACSPSYFSTAHGAADSGRRAADFLLTAGLWPDRR